jgi:flagellar biosynthesis anti-sigma factor FlgM
MNSIDRFSAQNVSRSYVQNTDATQGAAPARPHHGGHRAAQTQQGDTVSLSDSAKSLASARQSVQAAPDVREQKVADIKQRVHDGTYDVPSRVLARKMLDQQAQQ